MLSHKKIYLACPYSSTARKIREYRYNMACLAAGLLIEHHNLVFSPISHSHGIYELSENLEMGYEHWRLQDEAFIDWAECIVVLKLKGWKDSKGIKAEIEYAQSQYKPIYYIELTPNGELKWQES